MTTTIKDEMIEIIGDLQRAVLTIEQLADRCHADHLGHLICDELEEYRERYNFVKNDGEAALCWMSDHHDSIQSANYAINTVATFALPLVEKLEMLVFDIEEDQE